MVDISQRQRAKSIESQQPRCQGRAKFGWCRRLRCSCFRRSWRRRQRREPRPASLRACVSLSNSESRSTAPNSLRPFTAVPLHPQTRPRQSLSRVFSSARPRQRHREAGSLLLLLRRSFFFLFFSVPCLHPFRSSFPTCFHDTCLYLSSSHPLERCICNEKLHKSRFFKCLFIGNKKVLWCL